MGKQSKAPKQENFGKGKVTPVQVAFMVDRYLSENNYTKTLSVFRTEASNLFSKTKGGQAPKGLLSLGAILDEYICLKEQKLVIDNEKCRVEKLLQGMQDAMNAYNSAGSISPGVTTTPISQMGLRNGSHEVTDQPIYNNHTTNIVHMLPPNTSDGTNSSTPIISLPSMNKRKASRPVSDVSVAVKKSCAMLPMNSSAAAGTKIPSQEANNSSSYEAVREFSHIQSSHNNPQNGNSVRGLNVARNLFQQPPKPKTVSPCPKTPPRPLPCQVDESISPSDSSTLCDSSTGHTPPEIIPTNCHIISSKTVIVSPCKHIRISSSPMKLTPNRSNKRDQVKGRLDFNDSNMPMCSEEPIREAISWPAIDSGTVDIFSSGVTDLDFFGTDISLSELLLDIDLPSEVMDLPLQQAFEPSLDFITGSNNELVYGGIEANRASCETPASLNTFLPENGIGNQGPESLISVKSITKCIQIVSPAKNRMSSSSEQLKQGRQ